MSKIQGGLERNSLERTVHGWLKGNRIRHKMHPNVEGNPDVRIENGGDSFYVFIDGCFWHCCPEHYRRPKSNQSYWIPHVEESNARREERRKKLPYRWIRVWEHEVRSGRFKEMIRSSMSAT